MESSQVWGDAEECHSSESGWTMYIDPPVNHHHDDDDDDYDDDDDDDDDVCNDDDADVDDGHDHERDDDDDAEGYGYGAAKHESDSDDSMASDASSGPTHHPCGSDMVHGDGNGSYGSFEKEACKRVDDDDDRGRRERRRKGEKQGSRVVAPK